MPRNNLDIYARYRRLLILLLIFPIYKLIEALLDGDTIMALIMLISFAIGVVAIIYLEMKLKAAQTPSQVLKRNETA